MKIAVFNSKPYDEEFLNAANLEFGHQLVFFQSRLNEETVELARHYPAVCVFTNDTLNADVLKKLSEGGTCFIALRCAGYNNVDLKTAQKLNLQVVRVPAYSPYAVAEHALGLILTLNRKFHKAYNRVREGNFSLQGLLGFDLHGKTVGIIGTGQIGRVFGNILQGFGCRTLAYDPFPTETATNLQYVSLSELFQQSDIISLHCPLTPETHHLINQAAIHQMRNGVMIINTSRGGVIDTSAVIDGLKSRKIGALGLDVYEEEAEIFFEDLSGTVINDDLLARLLTFPNVVITGHQAFFTKEAMLNIAHTTLQNLTELEKTQACENQVLLSR